MSISTFSGKKKGRRVSEERERERKRDEREEESLAFTPALPTHKL